MKIVIALDSFKGCMTSLEAGNAAAAGIRRVYPETEAEIVVSPLADGGEGTTEALVTGMGGEYRCMTVEGPLGEPCEARYGYSERTGTAILEMAAAAGIALLPREKLDPMKTSTYGFGQIIRREVENGTRKFVIGIGGSATNDCGLGMLQALGYEFLDRENRPVGRGGAALGEVASIRTEHVPEALRECSFRVACDVENPLCGPKGCSAVYGPQKGATPEMVKLLDGYCAGFAELTARKFSKNHAETPGAGAAGGLGFAFLSYLNGKLEPGIDIVLNEIGMERLLQDADYLITGEGRLDFQSVMGKGPVGIARMAEKHGVVSIGLAGSVTKDASACNRNGIHAFFSILPGVMDFDTALDNRNAQENMANTAEQVFRLIKAVRN